MSLAAGSRVTLRRATLADREAAWRWLNRSDPTPRTVGASWLAHRIPLTVDAFEARFGPHVFDGSLPFLGRGFVFSAGGVDAGFISHGPVNLLADVVELDVWLAEPALRGRGLGSDALATTCEWLQRAYGVNRFLLRPSRRDVHALRAMRRAGFRETDLESAAVVRRLDLSPGWYGDEVLLFRILPIPAPVLRRLAGRRYLFIDSEFTRLEAPRLISFAAVTDDHAAFYCELDGWHRDDCSEFVHREVLTRLEGPPVSRIEAAGGFVQWLRARTDGAPVTLVSDSGFDRWAVHALLGGEELPERIDWLRVPVSYEEMDDACKRLALRRHHALDDARALQQLLQAGVQR